MDTTNPHYLSGFVRESVAAGLSLDTTMKLVKRAHDIHLVNDPSFVRGFQKEAAGLLDSLKTGWDGLSPEAKGGLAGAGIGGLGGFMFGGEHPFRNALLGAAGGGAAGYGLGHMLNSGPHEDPHGTNGPEVNPESAASRDAFLQQNSPAADASHERAQLMQVINNKTLPVAQQLAAAQRLQQLTPKNEAGLGVGGALASTAVDYGHDAASAARSVAHGIADSGRVANSGLQSNMQMIVPPPNPYLDAAGNPSLPANATPEQQAGYLEAVRKFHGQ